MPCAIRDRRQATNRVYCSEQTSLFFSPGNIRGTRRRPAAEDGVPPSLQIPPLSHILLARSPAPYSPFRRRAHSPAAFSAIGPERLPNTYTQDAWFLQPKCRPAWLTRRTIFSRCICRCSRMSVRLSPPRPPPSRIHAGWMVSATKMPTSVAPSQDSLFPLYM